LGDLHVGKTSVIARYVEKEYDNEHFRTVGIDHINKKYFSKNYNKEVRIKIWDTAG